VERSNVAALERYTDSAKKALDQKNAEVERLRKECEQLRQSATPKHESTPQ
jgi:prefoldin subunit 5